MVPCLERLKRWSGHIDDVKESKKPDMNLLRDLRSMQPRFALPNRNHHYLAAVAIAADLPRKVSLRDTPKKGLR